MSTSGDVGYRVGPVLHATPFAWSVISVIEEENTDVRVQDEGAYLRVLVPPRLPAVAGGARGRHGLGHPVPR